MQQQTAISKWPDIPYLDWQETCSALHLFAQIVGKYRLAHTPWVNHSWHATLYLTPWGVHTSPIPDPGGITEVSLDLQQQTLTVSCESGKSAGFVLEPMSVADFHQRFVDAIRAVGGTPEFHGTPNELPDPVPFKDDTLPRPWDANAVSRFHQAMLCSQTVFQQFRTGFLGKVSPVHLFWGSLDLAVTRFSGRTAPVHPGGIPSLPDAVTREAYSHEVCSAGFWAGGGPIDEAAFYAYAYPTVDGFKDAPGMLEEAYFDDAAGEFILPYRAVRRAKNPEQVLLGFLQASYDAAASLGNWDRAALDCAMGRPGVPPG